MGQSKSVKYQIMEKVPRYIFLENKFFKLCNFIKIHFVF